MRGTNLPAYISEYPREKSFIQTPSSAAVEYATDRFDKVEWTGKDGVGGVGGLAQMECAVTEFLAISVGYLIKNIKGGRTINVPECGNN